MQNAPTASTPVSSALVAANTHFVGNLGLGVGAASIAGVAASVSAVFSHLSDGAFLQSLAFEHANHQFGAASSALDGSLVGVVGSIVALGFGLAASYLGRPKTIVAGA